MLGSHAIVGYNLELTASKFMAYVNQGIFHYFTNELIDNYSIRWFKFLFQICHSDSMNVNQYICLKFLILPIDIYQGSPFVSTYYVIVHHIFLETLNIS